MKKKYTILPDKEWNEMMEKRGFNTRVNPLLKDGEFINNRPAPEYEAKAPTIAELAEAMESFKIPEIEGLDGGPLVRTQSRWLPVGAGVEFYTNEKYDVLYWPEQGRAIVMLNHNASILLARGERYALVNVEELNAPPIGVDPSGDKELRLSLSDDDEEWKR